MGFSNITRPQEPTPAINGQKFSKEEHLHAIKNAMNFCNSLWTAATPDSSDDEAQELMESYCRAVDFLSELVSQMKSSGYSIDFGTVHDLDDHEFVLYKGDEDGVWQLHE